MYLLNDYYEGKIKHLTSSIKSIDFMNVDYIDNLIYKFTGHTFILDEDDMAGTYSFNNKEISLSIEPQDDKKEITMTLLHEIGHYYQYKYGKDVDRKTFNDYLKLEWQAEQFSIKAASVLERKFNTYLIPNNYIPAYTKKWEITFLKEYHGFI